METLIPFIDMHCDTLTPAALHHRSDISRLPDEQIDLLRLRRGGCMAQFFAVCLPELPKVQRLGRLYPGDDRYFRFVRRELMRTLEKHPDLITLARRYEDIENAAAQGRIAALLTIEDGRLIEGSLKRLNRYYQMGVRLITLTWNYANCFGSPNSTDPQVMQRPLSDFGREAIPEMNRLGIIIDVSHLSDGGFYDVAALSKKPFAASHSNCRALCAHPRNLTDDMIRVLAEHGGVAGLNQYPQFLYDGASESRMEDLVRHLRHLTDVGGIEVAALGSDFDGFTGTPCLKGPQDYPRLAGALLKEGFSSSDLDKIFHGNVLRFLKDVLS